MSLLLSVAQPILASLLADVGPAIKARGTMPILAHVLIQAEADRLTLTGTDTGLTLRSAATAHVKTPGAVTVDYAKLKGIVGSLSAEADILIEQTPARVIVKAGRSRFVLSSLDPDSFPVAAEPEGGDSLELDGAEFLAMANAVKHAMGVADVRYYLNGMLLQVHDTGLTAVATDGHRLAKAGLTIAHGLPALDVIIPRESLLAALRWCQGPIRIDLGTSQWRLTAGERVIVSKLVDGKYPDYARVIPDYAALPGEAVLEREELLAAIKRVALCSHEQFKGIELLLPGDGLTLKARNTQQDEAEEAVATEVVKPMAVRIGCAYPYLEDVLNATRAARVRLHHGREDKQMVIVPADQDGDRIETVDPPLWVIMPMLI